MLAGDTGIGKSWLCLNIIRAMVLGEPLFVNPDWQTRKSRVLYIENEVGKMLGERLRKSFPELTDSMPYWCHQPDGVFDIRDPKCIDWIRGLVEKNSIDVVVLDPISELAGFDENSNQDVNNLIKGPMSQLKATVIFSHHVAKPPYDKTKGYDPLSLNNARGAKAFSDRVDSVLMVAYDRPLGEKSWSLKADWAKTRHVESKPSPGVLRINEFNNGKAVWCSKGSAAETSFVSYPH